MPSGDRSGPRSREEAGISVPRAGAGNVYFGYDPLGRGTTEVYEYAGLAGVTSQTSALSAGGVPITLTLTTPETTDTLTYDYDSAWRNTTWSPAW